MRVSECFLFFWKVVVVGYRIAKKSSVYTRLLGVGWLVILDLD